MESSPRLTVILNQFEHAWRDGKPPNIEEIAKTVSDDVSTREFLIHLIELDLGLRWRDDASFDPDEWATPPEKWTLEDYAKAHPAVGPVEEFPLPLIGMEYRARRLSGDQPDIQSYLARFPHYADELTFLLSRIDQELSKRTDETIIHDSASKASQDSTLRVRCPHCQDIVETSQEAMLSDLTCTSCGDAFSLVDGNYATKSATIYKTFGHFDLVEKLGFGGFGEVWKAHDRELDRTVAIKIPRKGQLEGDEAENFLREARTAAQLNHSNIVSIHEVGREGDTLYIVSDLVRGLTLADWLTGMRPAQRQSAEICRKIAEALHHAHDAGVIHRDLKPGNIMLDDDLEPHVMDFGLAKREVGEVTMTMDGQILGTPAYMSPEQAKGEARRVDRRTDIYSLGVILFELLTGELPFRGNARMMIHQVINDEAPSPRKLNNVLNRDLETICSKCLEKDPAKRYATAQDFADELNRYLAGDPILARPISKAARAWRWCKRRPALAGMTAIAFLLLAGIGIVSSGAYFQTQSALNDATAARNAADAEADRANAENRRAERSLIAEAAERKRAETTLVDMNTMLGLNAAEQGDVQESLLWFANAAERSEEGSPREEMNRLRFRNWMRHLPVPIHAIRNPLGRVINITIHPGNEHALLHTSEGVVLWELESGEITPFQGCHAIWSEDGKRLAMGSSNGKVEVFLFPAMKDPIQFDVPGAEPPLVRFSEDGNLLAAGSTTVRVWNVAKQDFLAGEAVHPKVVASLEFASNHTCLVTSCEDGLARVFDVEGTALASEPRFKPVSHRSTQGGVGYRFFPPLMAGNDNVIVGGHSLRLLDINTGLINQSGFHVPGVPISNAAVDGSGEVLTLSGDYRGHIRSFDVQSGKELSYVDFNLTERAPGLCFRPGQNALATIGYDSTLRFWDPIGGTRIGADFQNIGKCNLVTFSPDGLICAISQSDEIVKLLRMPQGTSAPNGTTDLDSQGTLFEPAMDQSGSWFVTQSVRWAKPETELCVFETSTGRRCSATIKLSPRIISTAINADGSLVAALTPLPGTKPVSPSDFGRYWGRSGQVKIWDWRNNEFIKEPIKTNRLPMDCAFSPDGSQLVVVCAYGEILLINVRHAKIDQTVPHRGDMIAGYELPKRLIRYSPQGNQFAIAGFGKSVQIWSHDGRLVADLKQPDYVYDLNYSATGNYLATACQDGNVIIWDASSGKMLGVPLKHAERVSSVVFDSTEDLVATGANNRMCSIWNWRTRIRVCPDLEQNGPIKSVGFSRDGRFLITVASGEVRFWGARSQTVV